MSIKKLDHDRVNHELPISKITNSIPDASQCGITQEKDTLDNARLAGRNNCDMIKAFVDNPYTQPLNSIR